jgi:hypothetical protein
VIGLELIEFQPPGVAPFFRIGAFSGKRAHVGVKPARKPVDEALFRNMPAGVRALQKQSRKELRLKERKRFKQKNIENDLDVGPK